MPSAHSAAVTALATIIFLIQGWQSTVFAISLVFGILVLRDAFGVRQSVGKEGDMIKKLSKKHKISTRKFKYSHGHTLLEVSVGSIIGFAVALGVYFI